jgi:hypothetical protein
MFKTYAKVRGLDRPIVHVPFLTPRLSSHWIGLVTPISNRVARPLIEGLDNEVTVDDPGRVRQMFPDIHPIPYEAAVRLALRRAESDEIPTVWNSALSSAPTTADDATLETTEGLYRETRQARLYTSPEHAFSVVRRLGGSTGWLYGDALWHLRGWIDQLIGGVGFRKGRRSETDLRVGDAVDFWRVEALEPNRLLRLRAEMTLPGRAWLQFEVTPDEETDQTVLTQSVFFEPKGLWGTIYWMLIAIPHRLMFAGMFAALQQRIRATAPRPVEAS